MSKVASLLGEEVWLVWRSFARNLDTEQVVEGRDLVVVKRRTILRLALEIIVLEIFCTRVKRIPALVSEYFWLRFPATKPSNPNFPMA